jgi:anti-sigma factor RsiW
MFDSQSRRRFKKTLGDGLSPKSGERPGSVAACSEIRESLSARLDGESFLIEQISIERHLAGCPSCREYLASSVALKRSTSLWPVPWKRDLAEGIISLIGEPPGTRKTHWWDGGNVGQRLSWKNKLRLALPLVALGVLVPTLAVGAVGHLHVAPMSHPGPCLHTLMRNVITRG